MVSMTFSVDDASKHSMERLSWVNWSDVGRREALKQEIFIRYIKTGEVTDEDWKFCEEIDWHPVDELPLKEEFIKGLEKAEKGPFKTAKRLDFWKE